MIEIHIPYTRERVKSGPFKNHIDIGSCYNKYMKKADDVVIFRDSDVYPDLIDKPKWFEVYQAAIDELNQRDPKWGAITCFLSKIGNPNQQIRDPKIISRFNKIVEPDKWRRSKMPKPQIRNLDWHKYMAQAVWDVYKGKVKEIPMHPAYFSGAMFATNKAAWRASGGFRGGFYGVDVNYGKMLRKKGYKLYRVSLYVFHGYETSKKKKGG